MKTDASSTQPLLPMKQVWYRAFGAPTARRGRQIIFGINSQPSRVCVKTPHSELSPAGTGERILIGWFG